MQDSFEGWALFYPCNWCHWMWRCGFQDPIKWTGFSALLCQAFLKNETLKGDSLTIILHPQSPKTYMTSLRPRGSASPTVQHCQDMYSGMQPRPFCTWSQPSPPGQGLNLLSIPISSPSDFPSYPRRQHLEAHREELETAELSWPGNELASRLESPVFHLQHKRSLHWALNCY